MRDGTEFDAVRFVGFVAEQFAALFVAGFVVAFEPGDFTVAFKRQNVRGDAVKEPAVVFSGRKPTASSGRARKISMP